MKKMLTLAAASAFAVALAASPASAAVVCNVTGSATPQCPSTNGNNVMVTQTPSSNSVAASFNSGSRTFAGAFTSTELLNGNANGQANIAAVDGVLNQPLTFTLNGGTFTTATFNLAGTGSVLIEALFNGAVVNTASSVTLGNGGNQFGITATGSELFNGFRLTGAGLTDVRQVRLGGVAAAVPEPGTWALMLFGFGAVGVSMRRRRSSHLPQFA